MKEDEASLRKEGAMDRPRKNLSRETLERAARVYRHDKDAAIALGIGAATFVSCCEKFEIETPSARRRRLKAEAPE